jgi:Flp pilus assembly protein TadD
MRTKTWLTLALVLALVAPILADKRSEAKSQVEFGISVAQKGLWKEALTHWLKAVEIDVTYAAAWNDVAIAYEQMGQFDKARTAYEKAMNADPANEVMKQNFALFREIYDRQNVRRGK